MRMRCVIEVYWSILSFLRLAEKIFWEDLLLFCINGGLYKTHAESYSQLNYDQYQFASTVILQIDNCES